MMSLNTKDAIKPSLCSSDSLSSTRRALWPWVVEEDQEFDLGDPAPEQRFNNVDTDMHNVSSGKREEKGKVPAPRGRCKFDGTDYPDWLPINPFKKAEESFAFPFPEVKADPWAKAAQLVKDSDDGMCDAWVDEIQNILIFAGLFSAVVTAFAVETQKLLLPDPTVATVLLLGQLSAQFGNDTGSVGAILAPFQSENSSTQSVRINVLVYFSLVLSLGTAMVGIIALQWIRSYRQSESQSHQHRISLRHVRYESLVEWKVPEIISTLPLILQASLVIFFAGLIDFLHALNAAVTIIVSLLIGAVILFVLFTMVAPGQTEHHLHQATTFAIIDATTWPKLTQLHHDTLHGNIGVSLGNLIKKFTDLESFLSLFHCFQTLDSYEMQHALTTIQGDDIDEDSEFVSKVSQFKLPQKKPAAAEAKHILSILLIDWAKSQYYWTHRGIDLYLLELSLRSTTYSLPPVCPEKRMVPSRLPVWTELMIKTSPQHKPSTFEVNYLVDSLECYLQRGAFEMIDDILAVFTNWLENWQIGHPDEDVEGTWQQLVVDTFMSNVHHRFLDSGPNLDLLHRPAFLSVLDRLENHPKGRRSWKCLQSNHPYMQVDWHRFFMDGSLKNRYSSLVCDQRQTDGIRIDSGCNKDYKEDGVLKTYTTKDILPDAHNHGNFDDSPALAISTFVSSTAVPVPNIDIPHRTQAYSAEGSDLELGVGFCMESKSSFIEHKNDIPSAGQPQSSGDHVTVIVDSPK